MLQIETEEGKIVNMPYLRPEVFRPPSVPEESFKLLNINASDTFKTFADNLGSPFEFNTKLYMNWFDDNDLIFQAEYYRLNKKYDLDGYAPEKGICVVAPFRNLMKDGPDGSYKMFLKSIN